MGLGVTLGILSHALSWSHLTCDLLCTWVPTCTSVSACKTGSCTGSDSVPLCVPREGKKGRKKRCDKQEMRFHFPHAAACVSMGAVARRPPELSVFRGLRLGKNMERSREKPRKKPGNCELICRFAAVLTLASSNAAAVLKLSEPR